MQSFKKIYEGIKKSRRIGIQHLNQLKPMDFINLVKMFKDEMQGKINNKNASVTLKVDGFGCRFGLDAKDNFFLESSNSGPQFKPKAFTQYTIGRKGVADKISIAYDELFDSLRKNKQLIKILEKNNTESGIKVVAECLYNPIGKKDKGKIKFVAIEYDLDKLGDIATLVLIKVLDGDGLDVKGYVLNDIKKLSNKEYLFTDPSTSINNIDLTVEIEDVLKFIKKYPDLKKQVISSKHADREIKAMIKDTLAEYQETMSQKILNAVQSGKFSDQFEGIVIALNNGKTFKAISKDFKNGIKFRPKG